MIYTRFGGSIRIVGNCGEHQPEGFRFPATLIKFEWLDDESHEPLGQFRYYFKEFLKADGTFKEVEEQFNAAPKIVLEGDELAKAIQQAM